MSVSYSYTRTATATFSQSAARYVASKIATDLRQLQRYYSRPSDADIGNYAEEIAILGYGGSSEYDSYVDKVIYGFKRNGDWLLTLEYVFVNGMLAVDDRAGGVYRYADVAGAAFHSYMMRSSSWWVLSEADRAAINISLPFVRTSADGPGYTGGYHISDRTYSREGTGFTRSTYRPR
ncbi:MAG: hypothetical protein ACRDRO_18425 [Pseudonocardiaceae bacterium]